MASNSESKMPQDTELLGSAFSTKNTKLNVKRGGKNKRRISGEMGELGRTEVDPDVIACIDTTSLEMEGSLDQVKASTVADAATKPGGVSQHLDACTMESDTDPLCENPEASANDELLNNIIEDIEDSVISENEGHSVERDKLTQRVDSKEIDLDFIDEVMFTVSSSNDGSQKVREGLGVNKERTQVIKDNVGADTTEEPGQNRDTIESKTTQHKQPEKVVDLDAIDSEAVRGMGDADPDKTKPVSGNTEVPEKHAAKNNSSPVMLKRKRGRPAKKEKKRGKQPVSNEELLKLVPENGSYEFSEEAHSRLKEIFRARMAIKCPREGCTKSYTQLISFKYHVPRCGIILSLPCSECAKVYTSKRGLQYHLGTAHGPQVKKQDEIENVDDEEVGQEVTEDKPAMEESDENCKRASRYGRRIRTARIREEEVDDDDDDSDYQLGTRSKRSRKWMEYLEIFEAEEPVETSGQAWEQLMKEVLEKFDQKQEVSCPKKCGNTIRLKGQLSKHLSACHGAERKKYRCRLCKGRAFVTMKGIKGHIKTKHRKLKESDDEYTSEYSEGEPLCKKPTRIKKCRGTDEYKENTEAWYQAFHSKLIYPSWTPTLKLWSKLPQSDVEGYLPVKKMSPRFTIQPATESARTQVYPEFQLPIFSSVPVDTDCGLCNLTFNVGGSVWAMDWVPVPVDETESKHEYLAIGCHPDSEQLHVITKSYEEKGVLQIWRVAKLRNGKRPEKNAEFCLGLAYDYGPLWDIRWCPSGTWERVANKPGHLRRLGLLALGCADGIVRILSVPFPESLFEQKSEADKTKPETLIFRVVPHAELSPGSTCKVYRGECGPVWSVAWLPAQDHKKILASYGDGTIAIWDLTSQSSLLRVVSTGSSEKFFPFTHFQAHCSTIRASAWCPTDLNYIATTGYDRTTKVWDLRHTSQPITIVKRGFNYQLLWPLHWPSLMYCCDTAMNRNMLSGVRNIDYVRNEDTLEHTTLSLSFHNSAAWDGDYCNWSNMLVSVDASGEVQLNVLGNLVAYRKYKQRTPIFRVIPEEIFHDTDDNAAIQSCPDPIDPTLGDQNMSADGEKSENEATPDDSKKRDSYKLIFKDTHPMFANKEEKTRLNRDTQTIDVDRPETYAALHKVRWNPNITSYYWLATGGRAGIVRICYVDVLD